MSSKTNKYLEGFCDITGDDYHCTIIIRVQMTMHEVCHVTAITAIPSSVTCPWYKNSGPRYFPNASKANNMISRT